MQTKRLTLEERVAEIILGLDCFEPERDAKILARKIIYVVRMAERKNTNKHV